MILELQNVCKRFGQMKALDDVGYIFREGVYGLLGPNGAGKSTLMNLIVDNLRPDDGQILYDGRCTQEYGREFRRFFGYMPQQQKMYEGFTVLRFMYYLGTLKGIAGKELGNLAERALRRTNMWEDRGKRMGELSGGMRQRVLLAQAIMDEPPILLLDEPTAGLDPKERIRIRNLISEIGRNKIVIYATHVVSDVELIADRIIFIREGKIVEDGTPEELGHKYMGHVREEIMTPSQVDGLTSQRLVSNVSRTSEGTFRVRMVERQDSDTDIVPGLEDIYLLLFNE